MHLVIEKINYSVRLNCAVCENRLGEPTVEMPQLPLTELYTREKPKRKKGFVDQEFYYCEKCGHGQLANIIKPSILYKTTRYYFRTSQSSTAKTANDYFLAFIAKVIKGRKFKNIVEIGSSDLYLLKKLERYGDLLFGIDPILKGKEKTLSGEKLKVLGDFVEDVDLSKITQDSSLILTSHTLEHLIDPKAMIKRLFLSVSQNSLFIFQFPSLDVLVKDLRYDQIFHQHLHYFSLQSFQYLLEQLGGELVAFEFNYYHWGTLLVAFKKKKKKKSLSEIKIGKREIKTGKITRDYRLFQEKMRQVNKYLLSLRGEKIYGFGASNMLPILSYHLKNDFSNFSAILDDDKNKEGLFYINLPVVIKTPKNVKDFASANVVITAVSTPRSVLPRVLFFKPKRIIVPISII